MAHDGDGASGSDPRREPLPFSDAALWPQLRLDETPIEGVHLALRRGLEGIGACSMCGAMVYLRLVERHRRFCEPRILELEPILPGELGPA